MRLKLLLTLFLLANHLFSQVPSWSWAWRLGGERVDQINQMETDSSGNVYVMGNIKSSSVVLGGVNYSASNNGPRNFFAKFSSQGELLWHRVYQPNMQLTSFAIGKHQEIYFFGTFYGTFFIGPYTLNSGTAVTRSFVAQLAPNSAVVWVNDEILDTYGTYFYNFVPHPNDGLVMLGISANPDTIGGIPIPANSNYLVRMSSLGEILQIKQLGGWGVTNDSLNEYNTTVNFRSLAITPKGALYVGGETRRYPQLNLDVWQMPTLNYTGQESNDMETFVAKFDSTLQFEWCRVSNTTGSGFFYLAESGLHAFPDESVVMGCSGASYPIYFDSLEIGPENSPTSNYGNGFIVKYSPSGEVKWGKRLSPTDGLSQLSALTGDGLGNSYVCLYGSEFAFPNQPNIQNFVVSKFDSLGNSIWNKGTDNGPGQITFFTPRIREDGRGNVFVAGGYSNRFGPSPFFGNTNLPWSPGTFTEPDAYDAFLVKLNNCSSLPVDILSNENQTFCNEDSVFVEVSGGPNFLWSDGDISQNRYINESGIYAVLSYSNAGCYGNRDTLNLTRLAKIANEQNIQICDGETFSIGNQTFNQSGIYQSILTAQNGCDSLVTTNLTVDTINAQIELSNNVFTAQNIPQNAQLQWLNCDDNYATINGETNPIFTATLDGNYALETSLGNCRDTSNCVLFSSVGLHSITSNQFKVYPIPADETLVIESGFSNLPIRIFDAQGRLIFETIKSAKRMEIDVRLFQSGLYFIQSENTSHPFTILHNR